MTTVMEIYRETLHRASSYRDHAKKEKDPAQKMLFMELSRELYSIAADLENTQEINPKN